MRPLNLFKKKLNDVDYRHVLRVKYIYINTHVYDILILIIDVRVSLFPSFYVCD